MNRKDFINEQIEELKEKRIKADETLNWMLMRQSDFETSKEAKRLDNDIAFNTISGMFDIIIGLARDNIDFINNDIQRWTELLNISTE